MPKTPWTSSFLDRLQQDLEPVLSDAMEVWVILLSIWVGDLLLKFTLGEDAKLFGLLPLAHVAHTADAAAILRFFWKVGKRFLNKLER